MTSPGETTRCPFPPLLYIIVRGLLSLPSLLRAFLLPVGAEIGNRNATSRHIAPQGVVGDAQLRVQRGLSPTGNLALVWFGFVSGSYTGSNAPNLVGAPRAPKEMGNKTTPRALNGAVSDSERERNEGGE